MRDDIPTAVWSGSFWLGNVEIKCHVLDNGQRIIEEESINNLFGGDWRGKEPTQEEIQAFTRWSQGQ